MATDFQRIQPGVTVYGQDQEKIGEVAEVGANYLLVQKGWLFTTDLYVPFSAIGTVSQDRVVLNVSKDGIGQVDWSAPPMQTVDEAPYAATTTTDTSATTTGSTDTTRTAAYDTSTARRGTVDAGEDVAVPIVEEELRVGKRATERGGIRVETRVEEQPVEEQVTLRDERVEVERRPVDRPITDADVAAVQEGTFEVRERGEEAIVDKQARVVEEVVVSKDVEERTETVGDTIRRTDVDVQETGGSGTTGTTRTADTSSTGRTTNDDTPAASTTPRSGTDAATSGSSTGEVFGSARNIGGRTGETQVAETTYDTNTSASSSATRTDGDRTLTDRVEGATGLDIDRDDDVAGRPQRS